LIFFDFFFSHTCFLLSLLFLGFNPNPSKTQDASFFLKLIPLSLSWHVLFILPFYHIGILSLAFFFSNLPPLLGHRLLLFFFSSEFFLPTNLLLSCLFSYLHTYTLLYFLFYSYTLRFCHCWCPALEAGKMEETKKYNLVYIYIYLYFCTLLILLTDSPN